MILAAGFSRRMGTAKMLLPYRGKSILQHVIDQGLGSSLSGISVVINPDVPGLYQDVSVTGVNQILINDQASDGMSSSFKLGLRSIPNHIKAVVFLLGDQPLLTSDEINKVIKDYYWQKDRPLIVQASYQGEKGHPVLFDRKLFPYLFDAKGDEGGRSVLKKFQKDVFYSEMGKKQIQDIDTLVDYEHLLREEVV
ncbi:nucleotidyltransferase family protein [Robertmurraya korlensis]|uniref:nucleotidyltransferase family protein n=1 Tax=Robertmurraya korlensis TaxID=519977 RepID=UPI0035289FDB